MHGRLLGVLNMTLHFFRTTEEEHSGSKRLGENIPKLFSVLYTGIWALTLFTQYLHIFLPCDSWLLLNSRHSHSFFLFSYFKCYFEHVQGVLRFYFLWYAAWPSTDATNSCLNHAAFLTKHWAIWWSKKNLSRVQKETQPYIFRWM